jgi:type III pantothenate kinase
MRSEAMHVFTAKLPEVPLKLPNQSVGFSTETALQNGAYLGAILESEGVVRRFEQEIGREFKVLFTGGDGWFLKEHFRDANANYQPNLVLIGLDYIGSYQGMP